MFSFLRHQALRFNLLVITCMLGACAAPEPAGAGVELRLLSWNVLHGADEHGHLNVEAKGRYIRDLHADIVFLQELDNNCNRTGAINQLRVLAQLTSMQPRFCAFMPFEGGEYGLGMLSALPIRESHCLRLPDGDEPRVALVCELELLGRPLLAVDVHFNWIEDDVARFAQAEALLQDLARSDLPCIVAGDFNDTPQSRTLAAFYAAGFTHLEAPGNSWNARAPSKDIDHILWRAGLGLELGPMGGEVLEEFSLSDHRPVLARLRVRARP